MLKPHHVLPWIPVLEGYVDAKASDLGADPGCDLRLATGHSRLQSYRGQGYCHLRGPELKRLLVVQTCTSTLSHYGGIQVKPPNSVVLLYRKGNSISLLEPGQVFDNGSGSRKLLRLGGLGGSCCTGRRKTRESRQRAMIERSQQKGHGRGT